MIILDEHRPHGVGWWLCRDCHRFGVSIVDMRADLEHLECPHGCGMTCELVPEKPAEIVSIRRGDHTMDSCSCVGFGRALELLRGGGRVARTGWNGKGMWIALQVPDAHSKMTLPYIYMSTAQGDLVPWLASQADILAEDWALVDDQPTPEA